MNLPTLLTLIALGEKYSHSALVAAQNHPEATYNDKQMLTRYLYGAQKSTDHIALQNLANQISKHK